jgi:hypothetical protein
MLLIAPGGAEFARLFYSSGTDPSQGADAEDLEEFVHPCWRASVHCSRHAFVEVHVITVILLHRRKMKYAAPAMQQAAHR